MINTDLANACIRELIRRAMGMPVKTVRPAKQDAWSGGQVTEIATVEIISAETIGTGAITMATTGTVPTDVTTERIDNPIRITASVNFYRSATADAVGIARFSNAAFARAASVEQRLGLNGSIALMRAMGLGFESASTARDLRSLIDATWESRGQVDLTFTFINRETATIATILSATPTMIDQSPGGGVHHTTTIEIEVSP